MALDKLLTLNLEGYGTLRYKLTHGGSVAETLAHIVCALGEGTEGWGILTPGCPSSLFLLVRDRLKEFSLSDSL